MQIEIKPGLLYFFKGEHEGQARDLVAGLRSAGYRLMVISPRAPMAIKDDLGTSIESILTLTESVGQNCIDPQNLMVLTDTIVKFIERGGPAAFLIEDIDLVKEKNDFPKMLRMVGTIYESLAMSRGIGMIAIDPKTLDRKELAYLGKEGFIVEERDRLDIRSLQASNLIDRPHSQNV